MLPHELATKLRKALLPIPTTSSEKKDNLDLEYWENPQPIPDHSEGLGISEDPLPESRHLSLDPRSSQKMSNGMSPSVTSDSVPPITAPNKQQENSPDPRQGDPRYSRTQQYPPPQQPNIPHGASVPTTIGNKDTAMSKDLWGNGPTTGSENAGQKSERTVDPHLKYAHLKIKTKGALPPSALKKSGNGKDTSSLPSLLQNSQQLNKPLAPQELFGSSGISLFGSSTQMGVAPDSPLPTDKQQSFGEIKMAAPTDEREEKDKKNAEDATSDSGTSKEEPFVPSYLTHLGLHTDTTDDSGLKIDSAFSSLQERQRRLSEVSAQVTEDSTSQDSTLIDSPSKEQSPQISKMFSFGSSLF